MSDPYSLFSLFFTEEIFEKINHSTNLYAQLQRASEAKVKSKKTPHQSHSRPWIDSNPAEIKVFLAILIYMGVHGSPQTKLYWRNDIYQGPIHTPQCYMTQLCFEQLKRYLHISNPRERNLFQQLPKSIAELNKKKWWYKLESLASNFCKALQEYYIPDYNLSIDELMIQFHERTSHSIKMPDKPIKQGYKIFALAEHGYIWTFIWNSCQLGIAEMFKHPDLTSTGSMVLNMVERLPAVLAPGKAAVLAPGKATVLAPGKAAVLAPDKAASLATY